MFGNKIKSTHGQERSDKLPLFGKDIRIGAALVGKYTGSDSFTVEDKDEDGKAAGKREVRYVKLVNAIEFRPDADGSDTGATLQHLAIGVPLNADTRNKLDPDTLPEGCFLLIEHTERDEKYNGLRRFRVEMITRAQYFELLNAEADA